MMGAHRVRPKGRAFAGLMEGRVNDISRIGRLTGAH
jgi:hypothetical protein